MNREMSADTPIYVVGFVVRDGAVGGFDWDTDQESVKESRLDHADDSDVTDVLTITLDQLALDGCYTDEAITDALDAWPELWTPKDQAQD